MDAEVSPMRELEVSPISALYDELLKKAAMNELDAYEEFCKSTDVARIELRAPERDYPLDMYYALGLGGEVGEVLEKIKKSHRDGVLDVRQLELELGDVMWYLSRLAGFHGLTLRGVLAANVEKLSSRRDRGKLHGSGDNR